MIAAAGAGMAPIDHEFFRRQPGLARGIVEERGTLDKLIPARSRMNVDFDYARIRSNFEVCEARIVWGLVTFKENRLRHFPGRLFHRSNQFQVVFQRYDGWHENIENAVSWLRAHGRARDPTGALERLGCTLSFRGRGGNPRRRIRWRRGVHRPSTGDLKADLSLRWQRRQRHREIGRINIRVVSW